MKCYFRTDVKNVCWPETANEEWQKGTITTFNGGRSIEISITNKENAVKSLVLENSEILFCSRYLIITGYMSYPGSNRTFEMVGVDVSCGWIKPREGI